VSNFIDIPLPVSLVLSALLLFAGCQFFRKGRRRIGTQPHCRRCDYLLIGLSTDRCPECGALRQQNTAYGEWHRRREFLAASFVILILGGICLYASIRSAVDLISTINWYQFRPTSWVMNDLRTGSGLPPPKVNTPITRVTMGHGWVRERVDLARIALEELRRREKAGRLSESFRNQLVEMGLAVQRSAPNLAPVQYDLLDYLSERMVAGDLTADQQARFYRPATDARLTARAVVIEGDEVPIRLWTPGWWVGGNSWAVTVTYKSVAIDEQAITLSPQPPTYPIWITNDFRDDRRAPCPHLGHHLLKVTALLTVHHGDTGYPDRGAIVHSATLDLSAPFDVFPRSSEYEIKLMVNPAMADKLRASMKPNDFQYNIWNPGEIFGSIEIEGLPVNIAFDVFARYNGNEYPLGQIAVAAGARGIGTRCDSEVGKSLPKPPATIDIVFRTSPKAARTTLDLYQIWDGELVFSGVPIRDLAAH